MRVYAYGTETMVLGDTVGKELQVEARRVGGGDEIQVSIIAGRLIWHVQASPQRHAELQDMVFDAVRTAVSDQGGQS